MTKTLTHTLSCTVLATVCALLAGCATPLRQSWVEDGRQIGTIWKSNAVFGAECRYVDNAGQLQRIEKRDHGNALLPGASVRSFLYDSEGNIIEERNCDAHEAPARTEEGYVIKKYTYSVNEANDRLEVQSFLNEDNRPVCTTNGYAFVRVVYEGSAKEVKEVFLENDQHSPASGLWDGVGGVARVKYTTLQGIGDVQCGVYYDKTGMIVGRKIAKGTCSYSHSYTF